MLPTSESSRLEAKLVVPMVICSVLPASKPLNLASLVLGVLLARLHLNVMCIYGLISTHDWKIRSDTRMKEIIKASNSEGMKEGKHFILSEAVTATLFF